LHTRKEIVPVRLLASKPQKVSMHLQTQGAPHGSSGSHSGHDRYQRRCVMRSLRKWFIGHVIRIAFLYKKKNASVSLFMYVSVSVILRVRDVPEVVKKRIREGFVLFVNCHNKIKKTLING
jgi:hypothetical protein